MMPDIEESIRVLLTAFQKEHWHVCPIPRLAVCVRGHRPVEVTRSTDFAPTPLSLLDDQKQWHNVVEYATEGDFLCIPTTGAAVVLTRINAETALVLDCPQAAKIGVVGVLGRRLANDLEPILAGSSSSLPELKRQ
jgi:hypothetical protein